LKPFSRLLFLLAVLLQLGELLGLLRVDLVLPGLLLALALHQALEFLLGLCQLPLLALEPLEVLVVLVHLVVLALQVDLVVGEDALLLPYEA